MRARINLRLAACSAPVDIDMTEQQVHVGRDAKLGQSLQGLPVEVFVNETKTPLTMTVDDHYVCTFDGGKLRPNVEQVRALGRVLVPGRNVVRYQLSGRRALFDIHACIYLWEHTDKVCVCVCVYAGAHEVGGGGGVEGARKWNDGGKKKKGGGV